MFNIPYANQQQSQIKLAESKISNIDKNLMKILQLFSIIGTLDYEIEQLRIQLAENEHFYHEELFSYLKQFTINKNQNSNCDFFDFSSLSTEKPFVINIINSYKDGIIIYQHLIDFLKQLTQYQITQEQLKQIERIYHIDQLGITNNNQNQTLNKYPLPSDIIPININQQLQNAIPLPTVTNKDILNSGEGINFETFKKIILTQSIPVIKQKAQKRKLIYETNEKINIQQDIIQKVAKIFINEIEMVRKCDLIRIQLNTDSSYNHLAMFNILDSNGSGNIEFNFIEQLMNKAQIPYKPQYFSSLVRRSKLLAKNTSLQETIQFEEFRMLSSVQCPYFKLPKQLDDTTISSNIEYSKILDQEISGYNSQQLSISRIPDKLKVQSQILKSKASVPLFRSCNPYINEKLKLQNSLSNNELDQFNQNDYIVYGTKKEWEELQHSLNYGQNIESQSLKSQISRIQNSQVIISKTQSRSTPPIEQNKLQQIQQQALAEDIQRKNNEQQTKELQQAKIANTKGYFSNNNNIQIDQKQQNITNKNTIQAPWYNEEIKVRNQINLIQQQQKEIQNKSGMKMIQNQNFQDPDKTYHIQQNEISKILPQSPRIESNYHNQFSQINNQQQNQQQQQQQQSQINNQPKSNIFDNNSQQPLIYPDIYKQKILDYKYDIPQRTYEQYN